MTSRPKCTNWPVCTVKPMYSMTPMCWVTGLYCIANVLHDPYICTDWPVCTVYCIAYVLHDLYVCVQVMNPDLWGEGSESPTASWAEERTILMKRHFEVIIWKLETTELKKNTKSSISYFQLTVLSRGGATGHEPLPPLKTAPS